MMLFSQWMKRLAKDESARGDLARDIAVDSSAPHGPGGNTFERWHTYLLERGACDAAIGVLDAAWEAYAFGMMPDDNACGLCGIGIGEPRDAQVIAIGGRAYCLCDACHAALLDRIITKTPLDG
jgi:hypothetical protein